MKPTPLMDALRRHNLRYLEAPRWLWPDPFRRHGWFAARPSGSESIYKIYAESFKDQSHLNAIVSQAEEIVAALNSSSPHSGLAAGRQ